MAGLSVFITLKSQLLIPRLPRCSGQSHIPETSQSVHCGFALFWRRSRQAAARSLLSPVQKKHDIRPRPLAVSVSKSNYHPATVSPHFKHILCLHSVCLYVIKYVIQKRGGFMHSDEFEAAFGAYLDSVSYDDAESALFAIIRSAFLAGWQSAGKDPPLPSPAIFRIHPNITKET